MPTIVLSTPRPYWLSTPKPYRPSHPIYTLLYHDATTRRSKSLVDHLPCVDTQLENDFLDCRMTLNNWLQARFGHTRQLTHESFLMGPQHDGCWIAIFYCTWLWKLRRSNWHISLLVGGTEYGRGMGTTKSAAFEIAACNALNALIEKFPWVYPHLDLLSREFQLVVFERTILVLRVAANFF